MAKRRRGGRSSGGGGGGGDTNALEEFDRKVAEVASNLAAFAKDTLDSAGEVKRFKASLEDMVSRGIGPAIQSLAEAAVPGGGGLVQDARRALGQVTATGNAGSELENYAAQAAFNGMPMDKETMSTMFPLMQARQQAVEAARQDAADVSSGFAARSGVTGSMRAADALGITDMIQGGQDLGRAIADQVNNVMRDGFVGGGRH